MDQDWGIRVRALHEFDALEIANADVDRLVEGDYQREPIGDRYRIVVDRTVGFVELDRIGSVVVGKLVGDNWFVLVDRGIAVVQQKFRVMVGVRYYCIGLDIDFEMIDDVYYPEQVIAGVVVQLLMVIGTLVQVAKQLVLNHPVDDRVFSDFLLPPTFSVPQSWPNLLVSRYHQNQFPLFHWREPLVHDQESL